jgi:hypothetical protein
VAIIWQNFSDKNVMEFSRLLTGYATGLWEDKQNKK